MDSLLIIFAIIGMEVVLSVDNAVVIAGMVKHLPKDEQKKALKYGILGAYLFRGLLIFASLLIIKVLWLKLIGGIYLIYIGCNSFIPTEPDDKKNTINISKSFWMTVVSIEFVDIIFSLDNILGVIAFTNNIYIILTGVFIGILAMRIVAGRIVGLLNRFPFLETSANLVIILLGLKLVLSYIFPNIFEGHTPSIITSTLTILLFIVPLFINYLKGKFS